MRQVKYYLTILLLHGLFLQSLWAGGWPQPKGKGYFKLSEWWMIADKHYTDTGLKDPNITSGLFTTSLYAEYGLSNRITGIVYFPVFSRNYFNNQISGTTGETLKSGEAINSIGDPNVGVKIGLTPADRGIVLSSILTLGLPLGESAGGVDGALQTGDGEFNQMLQMELGFGLGSGSSPSYGKVTSGFNNRTKGFSDEFRLHVELGKNLFNNRVWLIGRLNMIESLKNGKDASQVITSGIFANNTEVTSLQVEANYYITETLGISASISSPLRGEITYAANAYEVGFFVDMK